MFDYDKNFVNIDEAKNLSKLFCSSDILTEFMKYVEPTDVIYFDWSSHSSLKNNKNYDLSKNLIFGYSNDADLPDTVFTKVFLSGLLVKIFSPPQDCEKLVFDLQKDKLLLEQYKTFSNTLSTATNSQCFIEWFSTVVDNQFLFCNTQLHSNALKYDFKPLIPITSIPVDSGPPYLVVKYFNFDALSRKQSSFDLWNHVSVVNSTQEFPDMKRISLKLGPEIFRWFPYLTGHKFKLSMRLCARFAIQGLIEIDKNHQFHQLFDLCLSFFSTFQWNKFELYFVQSKTNLETVNRFLKINHHQYQSVLRRIGFCLNYKFPLIDYVSGQVFSPIEYELPPYRKTKSILLSHNNKKLIPGLQHLLKENKISLEQARIYTQKLKQIIQTGEIYKQECDQCKSLYSNVDALFKKCASLECDLFLCKNCLLQSPFINMGPGKKIPVPPSELHCSCRHQGSILPQFKIPSVLDLMEQENHSIWWCKVCHRAQSVPDSTIMQHLLVFKNFFVCDTFYYFVCDDLTCQQNKNIKSCPFCHHGIERSKGCNDMQCKCNNSFCFNCLRPSKICRLNNNGSYPCSINRHFLSL